MATLRKWILISLTLGSLVWGLTKGVAVRRVFWQGDAPVSLATLVTITDRLKGRPLWSVRRGQVQRWLKGEMVTRVAITRVFPDTLILTLSAPKLIGALPRDGERVLVDMKGRTWKRVPFWATALPLLLLPDRQVVKWLPVVHRVMAVCRREGIGVQAFWVSRWGEAAILLPDGGWIRLGNRKALRAKLRLGESLRRQGIGGGQRVMDVTLPMRISVWTILPSDIKGGD